MAEYTRKQTLNWLCYFLFCYDYFVVTVAQLTTQLSSRYTDWELEFYRTIDWAVRLKGAGKVFKKIAPESKINYRTRPKSKV